MGFAEGALVRAPDAERIAFKHLCEEIATLAGVVPEASRVDQAFEEYARALLEGGDALNGCVADAVKEAIEVDGSPNVLAAHFRQLAGEAVIESCEPLPGAERAVQELGKLNVPQAILANGIRSVEQRKARRVFFTGPVIVSEDIGARKPDLRAFAMLARELGLPAECIWFVGTDYDCDILPARTAGCHAVWLTNDGAAAECDTEAIHLIHQTDDVLDLIKEPYARALLQLRHILRTGPE